MFIIYAPHKLVKSKLLIIKKYLIEIPKLSSSKKEKEKEKKTK